MVLTVVAPTPEAAAAMARRLCPNRRLIGDPVAISPASPTDARRFTEVVKTLKPFRRVNSWSLNHARHH